MPLKKLIPDFLYFTYIHSKSKLLYLRNRHLGPRFNQTEFDKLNLLDGDMLFVYEQVSPSYMYRVSHAIEAIGNLGIACRKISLIDLLRMPHLIWLSQYKCILLHRIPWNCVVSHLFKIARQYHINIICDFDDCIFDAEIYRQSGIFKYLNPLEKHLHLKMANSNFKTLTRSTHGISSTIPLGIQMRKHIKNFSVIPNVISKDMIRTFDLATNATAKREDRNISIGYLSGTTTHDADFSAIETALGKILDGNALVRLVIIGPLRLSQDFAVRFNHQIDRLEYCAWDELPNIYHSLDIALAPLEKNNVFCACKSAIKFLEAGLARIPIVATKNSVFSEVIEQGKNGFLAETEKDWIDFLELLIHDKSRRNQIGCDAYQSVVKHHTTSQTITNWKSLFMQLDKSG